MFYVFNKSKIYSYLIALCTVVILFVAATTLNDMVSPSKNMVETGTNVIEENKVNNKIEGEKENEMDNKMNSEIKNKLESKIKKLEKNSVNS